MNTPINKQLQVNTHQITQSQLVDGVIPDISEGEVLMKVSKFAFTSNNITYAAIGHVLKYWDFYPVAAPWGIVPVWGYAEIKASKCQGIKVGQKYFGYLPMGEYFKVQAKELPGNTIMDISPHRSALAAVYNTYHLITTNDKRSETFIPNFRPLFFTSFLINYFLRANDYYSAKHIILTSASSKTALSLAHILKSDKIEIKVVGLTSSNNKDFVSSTGYYDQVLSYQDLNELSTEGCVIVDFSGNTETLHALKNHLGSSLLFTSLIGLTDYEAYDMRVNSGLGSFFFAPDSAKSFYKEHGVEKANSIIESKLEIFISEIRDVYRIIEHRGADNIQQLYHDMSQGTVDPSAVHICRW